MERLPDCSTAVSGEEQSLAGYVATPANDDGIASRTEGRLTRLLIDLLPPATVVVVVLIWMFVPQSFVDNPWSLVIVGGGITAFALGLEFLFERHAGWRMNRQEFITDLFYVILGNTAIAWVTDKLADSPLAELKASLGISTPWMLHAPFLVQTAAVVFLIEFGQYWMHRIMHDWRPFWLTHAPHHHITQLNAMKGWVGNPIELFLISLSVVALFDFSTAAVFCGLSVLNVVSTYAHANVRSDPPFFYSFFFTTIRNHSLHHSVPFEDTRCNYANSLILIDRVLGTYREGEADVVGQDQRKRLSIREQFMFPFEPVVAWIRDKRSKNEAAAH